MIRVGVDVGGTFTDIVLERSGEGADQQVVVTKVSSTPHDQSEGVVEGILKICGLAGIEPGAIDAVFHGTTVATNMVIERSGAEVGMITTRGFRDILHMARHKRPHNFSLQFDVPWQSKPLVKRRNRLVVSERIMPPTGAIAVPLAEDEVKHAAELFAKRGLDAVIVAFLFSFLNNEHEQRAKEIVKSILPDAFVSCSSDVVNTIREYERFSSAAMNAYIGPKTAAYLRSLEGRLRSNGIKAMVRTMQSNGGISTIENASELPIGLLLSGPAGGVIGGRWTGEQLRQGQRHHHRHRRHLGRHLGHPERRAPDQEPARHRSRQPAGAGADDRHRRDRRRRRLDRLYRSGRCVPRRPALGRRRARSRLLRQGRRRADGHRRAGRARPHGPGAFPRRRSRRSMRRCRRRRSASTSPSR